MSMHYRLLRAALCASLSVPILLLSGCSDAGTVTQGPAAHLATLSGELTSQAGTLTAILHSQTAAACIAPRSSFELSGSADSNSLVTLTGPVADGTLTLTGTLAADGKSLLGASYTVVGGTCAFAQKVPATAQAFNPITGNYTGNFADTDGQVAQVTANFSQSTTPDANGDFTLAGTATVSNNPCFPSAVPISNTQVTGGTFTFTYAANGNSVTANGTFSADASTLNVTSWTSSGTCGPDTGVPSSMTRQGS